MLMPFVIWVVVGPLDRPGWRLDAIHDREAKVHARETVRTVYRALAISSKGVTLAPSAVAVSDAAVAYEDRRHGLTIELDRDTGVLRYLQTDHLYSRSPATSIEGCTHSV